jgi:small basic protein
MTTNSSSKPPIWFWVVSVIALLWNIMGVNAYLQQAYKSEAFRANFNEQQLAILDATPAWATAAFAIAVFAGALGCIALLLRKKWAKPLFLISFIAVLVQFSHELFMTNASDYYDSFAWIMTISIPIIAALLVKLSKTSIAKNWIS